MPDNNGGSDGILLSYGASPFMKDIFVQADYMAGPPGTTWNYAMDSSAVSLAVSTMAGKGINLHIFIGNQVPYKANLGNPTLDWGRDFDPIKNANVPANRVPFFHYCVFGNRYSNGTSSGISRDIVASDFIVTLGGRGTVAEQTGTFLHELGHNLGLRHGSTDDTNNKPNHLSIMNYNYQFSGIDKDSSFQFLYSDINCNNLDEGHLNEQSGVACNVGSSSYLTFVSSAGKWDTVNAGFDWNQDSFQETSVSVDTNKDSSISVLSGGVNEYTIMKFNGGSIGSAHAKRSENPEILLWEPPMSDIPSHSNSTHQIDYSSLNLKPHNGSQFLSLSVRHPTEIFAEESLAFVTGHTTSSRYTGSETQERREGERGSVNPSPMPFLFEAPVRVPSSTPLHSFENSAVNEKLRKN